MSARFMQYQAVGKSMGITDPVALARFVVDSVRLEEEREERRQERAVMERRYAEAERRSAEDRQLLREVLQAVTNLSTDVYLIQCQLNTLSREVGQFVRDQSKSCVDFDSASDDGKPELDCHDENRCAGCDQEVPREDCSVTSIQSLQVVELSKDADVTLTTPPPAECDTCDSKPYVPVVPVTINGVTTQGHTSRKQGGSPSKS
jgi:uncharacterized coiled-coil protein SlyX